MSRPGALTSAELTSIGVGVDGLVAQLANTQAAWFKKLQRELMAEFGFAPQFRRSGAYRTRAEQQRINPRQTVSDHLTGRAIDLRNWQTYASRNSAGFYRILAANGFRNIQVNGAPFRSEPWHWVCVKTAPPSREPNNETTTTRRRKWALG